MRTPSSSAQEKAICTAVQDSASSSDTFRYSRGSFRRTPYASVCVSEKYSVSPSKHPLNCPYPLRDASVRIPDAVKSSTFSSSPFSVMDAR